MTKLPYPLSRRDDVVDMLHGEAVVDPYRWLEDGTSDEVRSWTAVQNALTAAHLGQAPARDRIRARLSELLTIGALGTPQPAGGRLLYVAREGRQNQPVLRVRDGDGGADRIAVDPNLLSSEGTTALDWYYPSPDGRLLAYGLSSDGSERSELHLLDLDTLTLRPDRIAHTRACSLAWAHDASGFWYTRFPAVGEVAAGDEAYHRRVHYHRIGETTATDPCIFTPDAKEHWPSVTASECGRWLVVAVARTFDATDVFLRDLHEPGECWRPVAVGLPHTFDPQVVHGRLWLRTNLDAPTYRLVVVDPEQPAQHAWREIVPARPDAVLSSVTITKSRLVLDYLEHASAVLQVADHDGTPIGPLALPTIGSVGGIGAVPTSDRIFFGFSSYTVPPSVYRAELDAGTHAALWRRVEADFDAELFVVEQVRVISKDGTPISMFLVRRRDLDASRPRPTYLSGYGGFTISMVPSFSRSLLLWLERGGIVAIPNLRGGGEYGEAWHRNGMLDRKQNTFDDAIAAAEWLMAEGWTTPALLAAQGGSNGGLLMGALVTQRPDLFGAVIIAVPLLDMLRYHRFLIARLWIPEYGCADDPVQYGWLRAYSPYHRIRDGLAYPAVLIATAESDTRVDPMHARKMAARLQAATVGDAPILLRLEAKAGHGAGKPVGKVLDELTDSWTFIVQALKLSW